METDEIDLWATDEVHFQQYGSRCRMWIPPEIKDPVLLHHPGRKSVGYFGAVRLRDGKFVYKREEENFNAQTFFTFMKQLCSRASRSGRRIIVITDNVKYHHAILHREWRNDHSDSFLLDYLPPYSPDLNPIERVWKLARRLCLHNRYLPTLEVVTTSVENRFGLWDKPNDVLRRLCAIT
jgi:transposase